MPFSVYGELYNKSNMIWSSNFIGNMALSAMWQNQITVNVATTPTFVLLLLVPSKETSNFQNKQNLKTNSTIVKT